jgi:hypothetical protein
MPQAGVLESASRPAQEPWWLRASALQESIQRQRSKPGAIAFFRLGDAVLQVTSSDPALLEWFGQLYGDCVVPRPVAPHEPLVRCDVHRNADPPLFLLTFHAGGPRDPAAAALGLLRETPVAGPYAVHDSPVSGWRLASGAAKPVLAARDTCVLIDLQQVPTEFLVEYLVSTTLAAQPTLLAVHAASLRIGDAGLLLSGPSRGGKTTTSLHLAARGHTLLGDETAVIRLATNEILPLRRAVNLRPGPRAAELAVALAERGDRAESSVGAGRTRRRFRIGELFPGAPARPARLRAAFFLRGFADPPSLESCRLTLAEVEIFDCMAGNDTAYTSWGLSPERRALRLLALRQVLTRIPCWLLTVGTPVETAELIERTMEELGC